MSTESDLKELAAIDAITEKIIGCAIEVHKQLGPGLLEQTYETAMCVELVGGRRALRPTGRLSGDL